MKASKILCAKSAENGVIVLEGFDGNKIRYIGSSVAKSVPCDTEVNSVAFSLKKGDKGFIAIRAYVKRAKSEDAFSFFLPVEWRGEMPFIDLESTWIPPYPDRLGAINYSGLMTEIDGIVYTGNHWDKDKKGMRYVSDHNLICKYLAGDVDADAVKMAVEDNKEDEDKKKISDLEKKIQELTTLLIEKENLLAKEKKAAEKYCQQEVVVYERWRAASKVIGEVEKQWFHRPSIKEALQEYNALLLR